MRALMMMTAGLALCAGAALADEAQKPPLIENSYGHHLIQQALTAHPKVAVIAMHAKPPGYAQAVIVASNIGRLGKPADADDQQVAASGQNKISLNKAGDRLEVLQPLRDVEGATIGAVGVVFPYRAGADRKAREAEAAEIRDRMARRIAHAGNLLDPWPYESRFNDHTHAQALVDRTLAKHPEVIILAVHATPPGSKTDVILGSNIGRIGKPADEDDLRVIEKGAINREVNDSGRRFEAEIPLNDAQGKRIGALGVVFHYRQGADKEALVKAAERIRDDMAKEIPSPAALVQPAR